MATTKAAVSGRRKVSTTGKSSGRSVVYIVSYTAMGFLPSPKVPPSFKKCHANLNRLNAAPLSSAGFLLQCGVKKIELR